MSLNVIQGSGIPVDNNPINPHAIILNNFGVSPTTRLVPLKNYISHLPAPSGGDDFSAIQNSLDNKMLTILGKGMWRADGLVIPPGHFLVSEGLISGMAYDNSAVTSIRARDGATSEWVVEYDGTPLSGAADSAGSGLMGLGIHGNNRCKGVEVNGLRQLLYGVAIHMTTAEGLVVNSGASNIEKVIVTDTFHDGAPGSPSGSAIINGADSMIRDCEFSGLPPGFGGDYFGGNWAGVHVNAGNTTFDSVLGEFADCGIRLTSLALYNKFTNCRADKNYGHGFLLQNGGYHTFASCGAHDNSKDVANTYDQWHVNNSIHNTFAACHAFASEAVDARYGFYDDVAEGASANYYAAITAPNGWDTAKFGGAGHDARVANLKSIILPAAVGDKVDYFGGTGDYSTSVETNNLVDDIPSGAKRALRINGAEKFRVDVDGINVVAGDVRVQDTGSGLILRSPGGGYWRVTIDNSGVLGTAVV